MQAFPIRHRRLTFLARVCAEVLYVGPDGALLVRFLFLRLAIRVIVVELVCELSHAALNRSNWVSSSRPFDQLETLG